MAFRFTEFIKFRDKQISLYIVEEINDPQCICFSIHIRGDEEFVCYLSKHVDDKWKMFFQNIPDWVHTVIPRLTGIIEERISLESMYLSPH